MHTTHKIVNTVSAQRFQADLVYEKSETLACETRIALIYNGISHTVMMAIPVDLEEFAIGFTLSERIVDHRHEIKGVDIEHVEAGVLIHLEITNRCFMALKEQRRSMAGRTGCGLCGIAQLDQAVKPVIKVDQGDDFNIANLSLTLTEVARKQHLFSQTGATHAAMAINLDGHIQACFEDVGRHIALDKLIGHIALTDNMPPAAILLTSRASFEMVQKAASANIKIILAMSAVTALALDLAEQSNITLVGFCRENRATIYTHPERINNHQTVMLKQVI